MAKAGVPDDVVPEAVHVGPELATTHVDVGDEQNIVHFKQEERAVAFLPKRATVRVAEFHDLSLRKAELARIAERTEQSPIVSVACHFMNVDLGLSSVFSWNVSIPVLEVTVEEAGENLRRLGQGHLALSRSKGNSFEVMETLTSLHQNLLQSVGDGRRIAYFVHNHHIDFCLQLEQAINCFFVISHDFLHRGPLLMVLPAGLTHIEVYHSHQSAIFTD